MQVYSTLSLYRVRFRVSSVRVGVTSGADVRGGRGEGVSSVRRALVLYLPPAVFGRRYEAKPLSLIALAIVLK